MDNREDDFTVRVWGGLCKPCGSRGRGRGWEDTRGQGELRRSADPSEEATWEAELAVGWRTELKASAVHWGAKP